MAAKPNTIRTMNSTNKNTESRREALLQGGVGPHGTATGGGFAPGVASASPIPTEGVPSMAPPVGNTTAETVVPSGTQRTMAPGGERITKPTSAPGGSADALPTLAERLAASRKTGLEQRPVNVEGRTRAELQKIMERKELEEMECVDRVGRRLNAMIDLVRSYQNVAKPVQAALAEAVDAYKLSLETRKERFVVRRYLTATNEAEEDQAQQQRRAAPKVDPSTNSMLMGIAQEVKALRNELNEMRSAREIINVDKEDGGSWTEVVRKKPSVKKPRTAQAATTPPSQMSATEPRNPVVRRIRTRSRPPAIVVDTGSNVDFPALAKKLKDMDSATVGNSITGMRKTRKGDLLLEVRGDQSAVDSVRSEVSRVVGYEASVRLLQQRTLLEIRDIDEWSDRGDVEDSVARGAKVPKDLVNVLSLHPAHSRTQTAFVLLPASHARTVVDGGRLKINVVSCRVRLAAKRKARCYKCLAFGHESSHCADRPDRRDCCRRCGKVGHKAADCSSSIEESRSFQKQLDKESSKTQDNAGPPTDEQ